MCVQQILSVLFIFLSAYASGEDSEDDELAEKCDDRCKNKLAFAEFCAPDFLAIELEVRYDGKPSIVTRVPMCDLVHFPDQLKPPVIADGATAVVANFDHFFAEDGTIVNDDNDLRIQKRLDELVQETTSTDSIYSRTIAELLRFTGCSIFRADNSGITVVLGAFGRTSIPKNDAAHDVDKGSTISFISCDTVDFI